MKYIKLITLTLLLSTNLILGQTDKLLTVKIDSINLILKEVDLKKIELNNKKIELSKQLGELIQKRNKLDLEKEFTKGINVTINNFGGILRDTPNIEGNIIAKIPAGESVLVFNWYEKPYLKIAYKTFVGYISLSALESNTKINEMLSKYVEKENNNEDPRLTKLIIKFGSEDARKIFKGSYWLGMTELMASESLGSPSDINRSTGSWGVHEQWIYSKRNLYLYFENGILKSTQD